MIRRLKHSKKVHFWKIFPDLQKHDFGHHLISFYLLQRSDFKGTVSVQIVNPEAETRAGGWDTEDPSDAEETEERKSALADCRCVRVLRLLLLLVFCERGVRSFGMADATDFRDDLMICPLLLLREKLGEARTSIVRIHGDWLTFSILHPSIIWKGKMLLYNSVPLE